MADYAASVLAKAQVMYNQRMQGAEMREKTSPTLMMLMKNTQFLIPDIRELRTKEERATKAYLKNRAARTLTSVRTHDHSGAVADSTEYDIGFTPYVDKFSTSLKRGDNNLFKDAEILSHEIENSFINLHEGIETALVSFLDTNKTTVGLAAKRTVYNGTNDSYEIALADKDEYWHIIKSIFRQEKFKGTSIDVIADSLLASTGDFKAQQGTGNSTNLGFQFSGLSVSESIEVNDVAYAGGTSFCAPAGMTGIIDWIPQQNRRGKGVFDSVLGGYSSIIDPLTGLSFAMHGFAERADTLSEGGDTQDEVTQWEMSIDLSPQFAKIATPGSGVTSPIFQVSQLAV